MGERRRRTMGERGAPPDPLNSDLYCRYCASKYCSCDGDGNPDEYWVDYYANDYVLDRPEQWAPDGSQELAETAGHPDTEPVESTETADQSETAPEECGEAEGWTVGDTVTVAALVVGTGAAVAVAGPLIGISAAITGFVGGYLLKRFQEE